MKIVLSQVELARYQILRNVVEEEIVRSTLDDEEKREKFVERITEPKAELDSVDEKIVSRMLAKD